MKTVQVTESDPLDELLGENVFVRTVTLYYVGKLIGHDERWLVLDDASWVSDTGRFHQALESGTLSEVEKYPGRCYVGVGAVVDLCHWLHALPKSSK